jgi:hypothetical protein
MINNTIYESSNMKDKNNSQYGTVWITNGTDNKKIKKDAEIPTGWQLGRKMYIQKKQIRY